MYFEHSGEIWRDFPQLVPGVLFAEGITASISAESRAATFTAVAQSRLAEVPEGELPEIQAWRWGGEAKGVRSSRRDTAADF